MSASTTLYSAPNSRGELVEWYLREIGADVNVKTLDMKNGEHKTAEFLAINPFGKVPALHESDDGGWTLFESGAILMYLAEKYDPKYPKDIRGRAKVAQWMLFANSTLSMALFVESMRERQMPGMMEVLEQHFSQHPFVMGDEFGVVDVVVGGYLSFVKKFLGDKVDMTPYPHLTQYMDRIEGREKRYARK
ncbi:hypothetical protein CDCA_CDCA17G4341 [Cyanidium caldarium]|uniref:Glutathione S-transferase n=1 Tax=Cyanidium caldarium TaxID=2771 RepID=A0AAV9J209_CYACA|nr:hypothetical protein CDCA_CDCA17G4341 [Cyanidium caldarium]